MTSIVETCRRAKRASRQLLLCSTEQKNRALEEIANSLVENSGQILEANAVDIESGKKGGMSKSLLDRLALNDARIRGMVDSLTEVIGLPDPVGECTERWVQKDGLEISRVRVPFGVVALIYEARPNVTVDASALCLKSGNAIVLRGSSSAINSNKALCTVISSGLEKAGLPVDCVQLVEDASHKGVGELLKMRSLVDVAIPRGGEKLISFVVNNSRVPVIETGTGNCHIFVDESADLARAVDVVDNAKTQRPSVCNAVETVLVHDAIAGQFLPLMAERLAGKGVELRGCDRTRAIVRGAKPASEEDYRTEFLDLVLAVKVVGSVSEAIAHINTYGSGHSDAILSSSKQSIDCFLREVDSACVYSNASTRFTDGNQFGTGMEIGISTQKLHARGPMSLRELTSTKFVVRGNYQVRR
jgi:glutamate-5-semialdehyde dehydrogenase